MRKIFGKQHTLREKGQVLVIVAITLVYLVAIMGLAIDTGYVYVSYSRLRRAVDAAALAATGEFKRNYTITGMRASATQQLKLNGLVTAADSNNPDVSISINTCDSDPGNTTICPANGKIAQKLVQIKVTQDVPIFFMAVLGFSRVPITIETVAQAASIDLVLVIQNSESMALGANAVANKDPSVCNPNGCHPFEEVKAAAKTFVNTMMYFPYDRVSLVTFNRIADLVLPLSDQKGGDTITPALTGLTVFNPPACLYRRENITGTDPTNFPYIPDPRSAPIQMPPPYPTYTTDPKSPCRLYEGEPPVYVGNFDCPMFYATDINGTKTIDNDPAWCGTTNPASGLALAGNHLQGAYPVGWPTDQIRDDAVWVILLLGTGAPTSAQDSLNQPICPKSSMGPGYFRTGCRDIDVLTRHCFKNTDTTCLNASYDVKGDGAYIMKSIYDPTNYDVYDRAFDMVDVEAANSIYIFTIGLDSATRKTVRSVGTGDINGLYPGETFLEYAAKVGGGIYRYSPDSAALQAIFLEIANKIATKITR